MDTAREPRISFQRSWGIARDRSASAGEVLNIGLRNIVFLAAHIPLGLLLHSSSLVGAIHGFGTLAAGMYLALFDRRLERVAYVGGYIIGAEVLWHMTEAPIFWEFGKYSISAIFITAIIRNRLTKLPPLPVLYFVLLLPSVWITLIQQDWVPRSADLTGGRDMISFNMSGPLALVVSAWFLSHLKLSTVKLQWLFLAVLAPIISVSTIALFSVASSSSLNFGTTSNLEASGNFGPNQVSSILGLGAILAFLFYVLSNRATQSRKAPILGVTDWLRRFLMICLMILFIAQSALTFSRGGLYNTVVGLVVAYFYLVREGRSRLQFVLIALFLVGFSIYVLLPKLNDFTGGAFASRFENTNTTGREEMIAYQLAVFKSNILFGVGPGRGSAFSSHTEYTRLLADHGLLGIVALLVLFIIVVLNIKRARTIMKKAVVASLLAWSFTFMAHVGMRLAAPSFMIGLTFATLMFQDNMNLNSLRKRKLKESAYKDIPLPVFASQRSAGNLDCKADATGNLAKLTHHPD